MNTRREFRSAVGKVVGTVTVPQTVVDDEDIHPQNLKPLASYNWINDPNPTIMVPGTHAPFLSTESDRVFRRTGDVETPCFSASCSPG